MRKVLILLVLLVATALPMFAQNSLFNGSAQRYNTGFPAYPASGAVITVCQASGFGLPCTPLAPVCSSSTDTTCQSPNPFNADANGNYSFWAAPGQYQVTVTGANTNGYTLTVFFPTTFNTGGNFVLSGNLTFTGTNTHSGPETFTGGITTNSLTVTTLTPGGCVQVGAGQILTTTGNLPCGGGAATFPVAGVAVSPGIGGPWSASLQVGTAPNNLVQLNASSQLPAVSAINLTNFPTFNQNTTGNAATATSLATAPSICLPGQAPQGIVANGNAVGCATTGASFANALKPDPTVSIQYVALVCTGGISCSDSNDGLSWGTAKLTPYAALLALPGGSTSPPQAGHGVVNVSSDPINGIPFGGPVPGGFGGWWMFGTNDPNYTAGKTGWMRSPANNQSVTLECAIPLITNTSNWDAACPEFWGGHADNVHPAIWLNGMAGQVILRNFHFLYEATAMKIGIDSNNARDVGNNGVTSLLLDNDSAGLGNCYTGIGAGPAVDISGASFWVKINKGSYSGCPPAAYSINAISRASNVVTVTLNRSGTGDVVTTGHNEYILIRNVADQTFNGAYPILFANGTTVTYSNNGPNASSSGGQAFSYGSAAIGLNSGNGAGVGLIYVDDILLNQGGIWAQGGFNGVGLIANNLNYEGSGTPDMSVVEVFPQVKNSDSSVAVNNVQIADNINPMCGVENTGAGGFVAVTNAALCGAGSIFHTSAIDTVTSQSRQGQAGVGYNYFVGQGGGAGFETFSPSAVRFVNQVGPNTTWTVSGMTQTNSVLAPNGTTGASRVNNITGSQNNILFTQIGGTPNIGDTYIGGVWIRAVSGPAPFIGFTLASLGFGAGDYCAGSYYNSATQASTLTEYQINAGDGQWQWYEVSCKVITNPSQFNAQFFVAMPISAIAEFYGPVLAVVPAGTLSDNEVNQFMNSMQAYSSAVITAGDVSTMDEQRFNTITLALRNPRPTAGFTSAITAATLSANQTVTVPNVSGTMQVNVGNCSVNSVSPAACGAASSGAFVVPTSTATYTVNTTAVTAHSRIFLIPTTDASDLPSTPTCVAPPTGFIGIQSARVAGTSFTFTLPSTTGQSCWNYWIVN